MWLPLVAVNLPPETAHAQGTAITYQGKLSDSGAPANGTYDLQFAIYDASTNGDLMGSALTNTATQVSNGLFTATLDFGGVFNGNNYWLQIAARTNRSGTFTQLNPRQPFTPAPYAIFANTASNLLGALAATQLSGTLLAAQLPVNVVTNGASGLDLTGTFSGNGAALTNLNASQLVSGTLPDNVLSADVAKNNDSYSVTWTTNASPYSSTNSLNVNAAQSLANGSPIHWLTTPKTNRLALSYIPSIWAYGNPDQSLVNGFEFGLNGNQVTICLASSGASFNIQVDGGSSQAYKVDNFSGLLYLTMTFNSYANRLIRFEGYGAIIIDVEAPTTNAIIGRSVANKKLLFIGDSFTDGANGVNPQDTFAYDYLKFHPNVDVWADAVGGSGYCDGINTNDIFINRFRPWVLPNSFDAIIVTGGYNDGGTPSNTLYAAASLYYQTIKSNYPNAFLGVVLPFNSLTPLPTGTTNAIYAIRAACRDNGVPFIDPSGSGTNDVPGASPWIYGYHLDSGNAGGNAAIYISSDGTHPTLAGHLFLEANLDEWITTNLFKTLNASNTSGITGFTTTNNPFASLSPAQLAILNGNGGGVTNTQPATFAAEQFGFSTTNTDAVNASILNGLLSACGTNSGGVVTVTLPGVYYCKPVLAVWPNTTVRLGGGVTLRASGTNEGLLFGVWYCPTNTSFFSGGTNYFLGNTTMATNVLAVTFTNGAAGLATSGLDTNYIGAVLIVDMPTNGQPFVWGPQVNWLPGSYVVTNVISNNLYLSRNICSGPATNLQGCLGYAMFRDALYDSCPPSIFGTPQTTNNTYCSTNIIIQGPGTIDMNRIAALNSMQGYFCYALWFRQTERNQICGALNIENCPIYATLFEDCADYIHSDVSIVSLRDGMHYAGPCYNGLTENVSGACGDNMSVFCQGYGGVPGVLGGGYPIDSEPMVGFQGGGFKYCTMHNIIVEGGDNPVRICGGMNAICANCTVDGVHGWIGTQYANGTETGPAVTVIDDVGNTGMTIQNLNIENIDATCPANVHAVYAWAANLQDINVDNVTIQGSYGAAFVANFNGLGLHGCRISNISINPSLANIGPNVAVSVEGTYGLQFVAISHVNLIASTYPSTPTNGIFIYDSNVTGLPISLSDIALGDYNLLLQSGYTYATEEVNLDNVTLSGGNSALPLIAISGGSPTFNFGGNVQFNNCSDRCIRLLNNSQNGTLTLDGSINYGNLSSDASAPIQDGTTGAIRVNGDNLHIYDSNDTPQAGDMIYDLQNTVGPAIYRNGQWIPLGASSVSGVGQIYTNAAGARFSLLVNSTTNGLIFISQ